MMGSLPGNKDGAVSMDTSQSSGSDTETTDDRSPDSATSKVGKNTTCNTTTVKGSENSIVIGAAYGSTINLGEKQLEGLSCNITEGAKPKLKISVPAEDGRTLIHVDCKNGEVIDWFYHRHVDIENTFGSTWTFGNIFDGFMAAIINGKTGDAFFDLIGKLVERYDCELYKFNKKCLVIEFLHETEEGRNKMIKEQDTVRQMFQKFMESVKPNAPVCTLDVKEIETPTSSGKLDTASKYSQQDASLTSTSSSAQARSPEIEEEHMSEYEYLFARMLRGDFPFYLDWQGSRGVQLEEFGDIVFGLVPVSQVDWLRCGRCSDVLYECGDELSTLENVFFFHWDHFLASRYEKIIQRQLSKILTAFRNSHGGVFVVHDLEKYHSEDCHKYFDQIFDSILNQDMVTCEVFKTQKIRNYEDVFRIDVEPSDMFVTLDFKTKFPSLSVDKFENASHEKMRHFLFSSRTTESTNAALHGVSSQHQNLGALRLYCHKRYAVPTLEHDIHSLVSEMTRLSVPEHISALSKKKGGGTIHVVMSELKFEEIPLDLQKRIKDHLMQALMKKLRFQKNKHSKVSLQDFGVFEIALSKDTETGDCIIEIAVGHVNGCVFYDPGGPESYKIEGDILVRLPFKKWIEEAFE